MNSVLGIVKMGSVHHCRRFTLRSHLHVPLVFKLSIVRNCHAKFPLPLTRTTDFSLTVVRRTTHCGTLRDTTSNLG